MIDLDLAELARERHDYEEAARCYDRALAALPGGDAAKRMVAHRGRASCRYRMGRALEATADYVEARRLSQVVADAEAEVEIILDHATALDWCNDWPGSSALASEADAVARRAGVRSRSVAAGLAVARGRALFREGKWADAATVLGSAVVQAEQLGHLGYEPLVIALLLLEVVLPNLNRIDEAAQISERVIALTTAKRDKLNLASALNNRRNVLVAKGEIKAAIADQQQFMQIGRELGLVLNEYFAEYNMGELLYQAGDLEGAAPHVLNASKFESSHPDVASRPVASLLRARLLAFQGLVDDARKLLGEIQISAGRARVQGRASGSLAPSEEILAAMVDLATRDATAAEWDALVARSERESLEQEPIEVLEMRALSARRGGRGDEADQFFARALQAAGRIPNLMEPRVKKGRDLKA